MTVARGELQSLLIHPEKTFGTRVGNIGWWGIPHNSEGLIPSRQWFESARALGDRQVADGRLGRHSVTGDITSEMCYANLDRLLEMLLGNYAFQPDTDVTITAATISASDSDNSFNDSGSGFLSAGFAKGQRVTVSGFAGGSATNNNTTFWITSVTAGKMIVSGSTVVTDVEGDTVTIALSKGSFPVITQTFGQLTAESTDDSFTMTSVSGVGGIAANDFIYVEGWSTTTADKVNNGLFKVLSTEPASSKIYVIGALGAGLVASTNSTTVTIRQVSITNGTAELWASVHALYSGPLSAIDRHDALGCVVTQGALTIPANGIVTMNWSFLGREYDETAATVTSTVDQDEYAPFDGLSGTYKIGTSLVTNMTAFSMTVANGHTPTECLGSNRHAEAIPRKCRVSGSFSVYHSGTSYLAALLNETETSITVTMTDPDGNRHIVIIPRVKITSGGTPKQDDGPVVETCNYTALKDQDATDITVAWVMIPAA